MRLTRLSVFLVVLTSFAVVACGDDGGSTPTDAKVFLDAAAQQDAPPAGITGLGQKCGTGLPACPANASECVGLLAGGAGTYCTPKCLVGGTGTTNAQGQFTAINPAPNNGTCTAAYTQSVGMGTCGVIMATVPNDNPLMPNKAYTGIEFGCAVLCGAASACPTGLTANNSLGVCLCFPT